MAAFQVAGVGFEVVGLLLAVYWTFRNGRPARLPRNGVQEVERSNRSVPTSTTSTTALVFDVTGYFVP